MEKVSRRDFLRLIVFGTTAATLEACGVSTKPIPEKFTQNLNAIPESPNKKYATSGLNLFYTRNTSINAAGLIIPINSPGELVIVSKPNIGVKVTGGFSFLKDNPSRTGYYPKVDQTVKFPYIFSGPDTVSVLFSTKKAYFSGIEPQITIDVGDHVDQRATDFVITKELITAGIYIKILEDTVKKATALNLPLTIDGREVLTSYSTLLVNQKGQFLALPDTAATIMTIWAYKDDPRMIAFCAQQPFGKFVKDIISFAPTTEDPFQHAIGLLNTNPILYNSIPHAGNYSKIP